MTDMMVGLLFIFIIMLVYFAIDYQEMTAELSESQLEYQETVAALSSAQSTRTALLQALEQTLRERGVQVTIDTQTGVLRLPEEVLFAKGAWELAPTNLQKIETVAATMAEILPCYTYGASCAPQNRARHRVDAIFIEGHTDSDPMRGQMDNYDLSMRRAVNTFRALRVSAPLLETLRNGPDAEAQSILGVSGYGPDRPIDIGDTEDAKSRNRRIDLRFLMQTPGGNPENPSSLLEDLP
ncbi:OmpA/MotB family protein [Henriciella barbarensis]|nr:OmpA family protein [Henriciella barbarensis]